jgi:predicted amidohydrolase
MQHKPLIACAILPALLAFPCHAQPAQGLRVELKDFGQNAPGWSGFAQRDEIRPKFFVDTAHYRSAPDSLAISGDGNPLEYGGWAYPVPGVRGGRYYRLTAYYRADSVPDERRQILVRLDWTDKSGQRTGRPDYAYENSAAGDWTRVTMLVPAPDEAASARIELILGWAPKGTVWWDDITLEEAPTPPDRWVRVGTVSLHPKNNPDNVGAWLKQIDEIAKEKPDIICLGEEILNEGVSLDYLGTAQPIPGPATARLGESARKYGMYIVAGLIERDGPAAYNTCVLIDRHGNVAGKYHKVYLPREEIEGGLMPGDSCPVFDTDFGRIGMMVCWDAEYVEPARALATQGAEIILVPAAGGYMTLLKARAFENHLFIVSSGYDVESSIIDPEGEVLFETKDSGVNKVIAVNLQKRYTEWWVGDMRPRFHKEMRPYLIDPTAPGK